MTIAHQHHFNLAVVGGLGFDDSHLTICDLIRASSAVDAAAITSLARFSTTETITMPEDEEVAPSIIGRPMVTNDWVDKCSLWYESSYLR